MPRDDRMSGWAQYPTWLNGIAHTACIFFVLISFGKVIFAPLFTSLHDGMLTGVSIAYLGALSYWFLTRNRKADNPGAHSDAGPSK